MAAPTFVDEPAFTVGWANGSLSPAPAFSIPTQTPIMRLKLTDTLHVGDIIVVAVGRYRQQLLGAFAYDSSATTFNSNKNTNGNVWKMAYLSGDEPAGAGFITDFVNLFVCVITNQLTGTADGGSAFIELNWGNGGLGNRVLQGVPHILRFSGSIRAIRTDPINNTINTADVALLSQGQQGAGQSDPVAHTVWDALSDLGGSNSFGYSNGYNRLEIVGVLGASYYSAANRATNTPPAAPSSITIDPSYSADPSAILTPYTTLGPFGMLKDPSIITFDGTSFVSEAPEPANMWLFYRVVPATERFNIQGALNSNDFGAIALGLRYDSPGIKLSRVYDVFPNIYTCFIGIINGSGQAVIYIDNVANPTVTVEVSPIVVDSNTDCQQPALAITPSGRLYYFYYQGTALKYRTSDDRGNTWSAAVTTASTYKCASAIWCGVFPAVYLAIMAYNPTDSTWYAIGGLVDSSGNLSLSSAVSTGLTGPEVAGQIGWRGDGVLEFVYYDGTNTKIARCSSFNPSTGVGSWV